MILFSESCDSSVLSRVSESIKVESEYPEESTSPPSSLSQQSLLVSPDLQLHPVGGRCPGTAEPLPCPLAGLQVAQWVTAGGLARSTAGLLKSCPEASLIFSKHLTDWHVTDTLNVKQQPRWVHMAVKTSRCVLEGRGWEVVMDAKRFLSQGLSKKSTFIQRDTWSLHQSLRVQNLFIRSMFRVWSQRQQPVMQ